MFIITRYASLHLALTRTSTKKTQLLGKITGLFENSQQCSAISHKSIPYSRSLLIQHIFIVYSYSYYSHSVSVMYELISEFLELHTVFTYITTLFCYYDILRGV